MHRLLNLWLVILRYFIFLQHPRVFQCSRVNGMVGGQTLLLWERVQSVCISILAPNFQAMAIPRMCCHAGQCLGVYVHYLYFSG